MGTPFEDMAEIDRLVHEPARLAITSALLSCESADFLFLQRITGLSKGNLSSHLSKLERGGVVETTKTAGGPSPHHRPAHRGGPHHRRRALGAAGPAARGRAAVGRRPGLNAGTGAPPDPPAARPGGCPASDGGQVPAAEPRQGQGVGRDHGGQRQGHREELELLARQLG